MCKLLALWEFYLCWKGTHELEVNRALKQGDSLLLNLVLEMTLRKTANINKKIEEVEKLIN